MHQTTKSGELSHNNGRRQERQGQAVGSGSGQEEGKSGRRERSTLRRSKHDGKVPTGLAGASPKGYRAHRNTGNKLQCSYPNDKTNNFQVPEAKIFKPSLVSEMRDDTAVCDVSL